MLSTIFLVVMTKELNIVVVSRFYHLFDLSNSLDIHVGLLWFVACGYFLFSFLYYGILLLLLLILLLGLADDGSLRSLQTNCLFLFLLG
jgi:hypothetical protein